MEGLLSRSVEQKQKLEMIYLATDGQISQRVIRVLDIRDEEILAYCYSRRKVRTFLKVNILSIAAVRKQLGA
ncbi:hypothetical protein [Halobacillus amylolyticus]|uniref:Transcriptional regulator n=1 Tax=Halobacillus amylolyticus TaxID=2932259 RepID=A0ABY4HFC6_9BACI|nr:hypothetical protein [Halobacillus amylolyticus]UOR13093.1 hypothetical protein MUO15_06260 [Halobacillus amylolyticus]